MSLTARIGAASDEWLRSLSRRVLRLGAATPADSATRSPASTAPDDIASVKR